MSVKLFLIHGDDIVVVSVNPLKHTSTGDYCNERGGGVYPAAAFN